MLVFFRGIGFLVSIGVALTVFGSSPSEAFDMGRGSLKGLDGVLVAAQASGASAEAKDLTRESIQKAVELQLEKAGIKILSGKECFLAPGSPTMLVRLKTQALDSAKETGNYAYAIDVKLAQEVSLTRDSSIVLHADTWSTQDWGTVRELTAISNKIEESVSEFVRSHQAVNAEESGLKEKEGEPTTEAPATPPGNE